MCCPSCRKKITAPAPEGVAAPTQYGHRFKAALVYFHEDQSIPTNRVRQLCSDLFEAVVSEGTILEASRLLSGRLGPFVERVRGLPVVAPVLHADETGLRVAPRLSWCLVASTEKVTLLGLHEKRGQEGIDALGVVPQKPWEPPSTTSGGLISPTPDSTPSAMPISSGR
ncbi:MAG: IS66 family transposase [Leptospirales bacterium]